MKKHLITLSWIKLKTSSKGILSSSTSPCTWWNSKTETINEPKANVESAKEEEKELDEEAAVEEEERKKAKTFRKIKNLYGMELENYEWYQTNMAETIQMEDEYKSFYKLFSKETDDP